MYRSKYGESLALKGMEMNEIRGWDIDKRRNIFAFTGLKEGGRMEGWQQQGLRRCDWEVGRNQDHLIYPEP